MILIKNGVISIFYGECNNELRECNNELRECNNESRKCNTLFFIRNQFIRNEISGGKNFKKLESWILGNLRNFPIENKRIRKFS